MSYLLHRTLQATPAITSTKIASTTTRLTTVLNHLHPTSRTMATSIPKTMNGILIEKTGGTEVLDWHTDLPVPTPSANQILVKNSYIGINYIDTYFRTGLYPAPKPEILGREAAGSVVKVGDGSDKVYGIKEGDKVVWMGAGAYAEYTAVSAERVMKIPKEIEEKDAAACMLQGLTALTLVRDAYEVKKGDWILIHAAAGGVGLWLAQILKSIGARTIGTAGGPEKVKLAEEHGVEVGVDYKAVGMDGVVKVVKEKTGGLGVAAVFDGVGKSTFECSMECLARKGSMVSFGNASGAVPPVTITRLSQKNAKLLRPTLFNYIVTREEFETASNDLFSFMIKDKMDVRIHEIYPLKDIARAHQDLEGRKTTGKLILTP
ncbi:MAG: NADPH:quinone reductase [Cirrosporium novae-zelandiae]|nr:MAG: NADPH:quinone reductase [Cirrosporium novae-zelandiae]KAI9735518.1 MAG: NADPH:quinone reductase [Cirrosporium novae-zelandiae]